MPFADMISLTDCPGAKFDATNILPAYVAKRNWDVEVMYHVTCRDVNKRRLMGDIVAAYHHGLENVLVIRGDLPKQDKITLSETVHDYKHSREIIQDITNINRGLYLGGKQGESLDICVGCAVNPTVKSLEVELLHPNRLAGKINAGAQFAVTQMFFYPETYLSCLEKMKANGLNVPLIAGALVLENLQMIYYIEKELSGIKVPAEIKKMFEGKSTEDSREIGLDLARKTIDALRDVAPGFHIFNGASSAALELAKYIKK